MFMYINYEDIESIFFSSQLHPSNLFWLIWFEIKFCCIARFYLTNLKILRKYFFILISFYQNCHKKKVRNLLFLLANSDWWWCCIKMRLSHKKKFYTTPSVLCSHRICTQNKVRKKPPQVRGCDVNIICDVILEYFQGRQTRPNALKSQ